MCSSPLDSTAAGSGRNTVSPVSGTVPGHAELVSELDSGSSQPGTSQVGHGVPLAVARRLHLQGERPALLLSAAEGPRPGRSLLAIRPEHSIVCDAGAGAGLLAIPPRLVHGAQGAGVWLGAIAYDAGPGHVGMSTCHASTVPSTLAQWHATYAVYDHANGSWELIGPAGSTRERLMAAIDDPAAAPELESLPATTIASSSTRAQHIDACEEARRLIAAGDLFEVNLTHVLAAPWQRSGFELFERLLGHSAGDHSAYLNIGNHELLSISPENFLCIVGQRCETRHIKGTRRRGVDDADDARIARELLASEKDRAENVMIVDLMRNDLTATAVPGTVEAEALCLLERTASVMHLVSVVSSQVRDSVRLPDVLVSCFPGGSITGAPKRRAMEVIDKLERAPRGFYCGSIFSWEPALERLVASVAIRTTTLHEGVARFGAGGAVTLLSDPAEEAEETMIKARPFLLAVNARVDSW